MKRTPVYPFLLIITALLLASCMKTEAPRLLHEEGPAGQATVESRNNESYAWNGHAAPYDFLFNNHIDTHQQSKVNGGGLLQGFFYIRFEGGEEQGLPIARHGNCDMHDDCTVGWKLHGIPVTAKLVAHGQGQHPTWYIDPADMPNQPGYTHFHWITPEQHGGNSGNGSHGGNGGNGGHAGGLSLCQEYDGYLLKLTARESFFFEHHGGFAVTPGIDYVTHANVTHDPACHPH